MDLSSNNFSGEISIELTNLVGLRSLNLSRNNLTGKIPKEMGNMKVLESLDLSKNKFSGQIPSSFSNLFTLSVLNLSYNNLSGKIPSSTQLQGFNASCYIGNNLCGLPLSQACRVIDDGEIPKNENNEGDDDSEVDWFYVSMAIGFGVGFWVTCGSLFLIIIFLTFVVMELCICSGSNNTGACREAEKRALLCFKEEGKVSTDWVYGTDCCTQWGGVVCDNITGHVIELRLSDYYVAFVDYPSKGTIPHQLGNLSSLQTLSLSNADLKVDSLDWLSSISNLQLLDLSSVNLSMVHNWLEVINLFPSLRELHLSDCGLSKLSYHPLGHNSSSLEVLDLSGNEFINSIIPRWIFNLNSLHSLDLSSGGFVSPFPNDPWNLTSLSILDLSNNEFSGSLPSQLFDLKYLVSLNLGNNRFQGHLPISPWNFTSLSFFDISTNNISGSLPSQLFSLSYLTSLNLNNNKFQGQFPSSSWNLTSLKTLDASYNYLSSHIPNWIYDCTNLESLSLGYNQLQGNISNSISNLTSLSFLELTGNNLTGKIPNQIGKLSKLQTLDLSGNKFYGSLPESLGYLVSLTTLTISSNMLEGMVTESHFVNLTELTYLRASGNRLTLNVSPNWMPPFQLDLLQLSGWNLGSQFPAWLKSQHSIGEVDISNTGIKGEVPTWLWNLSSNIQVIDLSHNQLRGKIEDISIQQLSGSRWLLVYLDSNQFNGSLPRIAINITELDLSNNSFSGDVSHFLCHAQNLPYKLRLLHFGGNDLSGKIPDCWMHWPHLNFINMNENKLIGSIPNSIGLLSKLKSLDLHKNMLSGHLPTSLQNCTHLLKVDLGENGFTGKIPRWLGTGLSNLIVLRLRVNKFNGELFPEFCHLIFLQILDLANNNFSGVLPGCLKNITAMIHETRKIEDNDYELEYSDLGGFLEESALVVTKENEYTYDATILLMLASIDLSSNNFSGKIPIELTNLVRLRSLNLSRNNLIGNIPIEIGNMKLLESLDLSRNQISGEIPSSLSSISTLGVLDLSYNNLSGRIPSGTQLQGFNVSCYIGNHLCGLPLSQNCSGIPKHENKGDDDDDSEVDWFYISMAIGFAVGFWVTCGSLFLVRCWRIAYFQFLDNKLNSFFAWARALWV
ncbi:receptor-like protein EIX2 [Ipomoea triloba]|uniref:receptor-like protein EIX2 n=1 Tax=Ipomoea triloba TaxID=35885 RepID=UPI00125DD54C|nr:receptor-like protein EIX2 [Ipomoea triloba]